MSNYFCLRSGTLYCIAVLGFVGIASPASARTVCAETPAAAIRSAGAEIASAPVDKGYRVTGVHWDPLLRQNWATIASCEHPEWPKFSIRTGETNAVPYRVATQVQRAPSSVPVVRAGDIVRLWRQEDLLRIEVTGVAEQSGGLGKSIRVRLLRRNTDDQSTEKQFIGIIRGPSNVEMQR
jgi:hypothetical protein